MYARNLIVVCQKLKMSYWHTETSAVLSYWHTEIRKYFLAFILNCCMPETNDDIKNELLAYRNSSKMSYF